MPERIPYAILALVMSLLAAVALWAIHRSKTKRTIEKFGMIMTLERETRWSRYYYNRESKHGYSESRFMDGSASITLAELEKEWPSWTEHQRIDFCSNIRWANKGLLPDILRYIMNHGTFADWSACALSIATHVPLDESVSFLVLASKECPAGKASNLYQALAHTKAPEAIPTLKACLKSLWMREDLFTNGSWNNWVAFDAVCCINNLLELGEPPEEYREKYEAMRRHPNQHNRETTRNYLEKFFMETQS